MNQNVVKLETASTMTYLERETIAMMHREFYGKPNTFYELYMHSFEHALGVFASGGTIANITAMWSARNRALKADPSKPSGTIHTAKVASTTGGAEINVGGFKGVDKEGLFKALQVYGYTGGAVIIGSCMMHYSFKKAADLLGLGDEGLCLIPVDDKFQMRYVFSLFVLPIYSCGRKNITNVCFLFRTDELRLKVEELIAKKVLIIAIVGIAGTTET
jgi:glutamate decarboxylase